MKSIVLAFIFLGYSLLLTGQTDNNFATRWLEFMSLQDSLPPKNYELIKEKLFTHITFEEVTNGNEFTKPVLIYFKAEGGVNCRKIEERVLNKIEIFERITNDYLFLELVVNDATPLPEEQKYRVGRRKIETCGARYEDFQIQKFGTNHQPYFVILDRNGKIKKSIGYRDYQAMLDFLKIK